MRAAVSQGRQKPHCVVPHIKVLLINQQGQEGLDIILPSAEHFCIHGTGGLTACLLQLKPQDMAFVRRGNLSCLAMQL